MDATKVCADSGEEQPVAGFHKGEAGRPASRRRACTNTGFLEQPHAPQAHGAWSPTSEV